MQTKTDNAGMVRLMNTMGALDGLSAKVGWFERHKYPDGGPYIAQVAMWQEFGTKSIPPRPFMRKTIVENQVAWFQLAGAVAKRVVNGEMTPVNAFEMIAARAAADVRVTIADGVGPKLSPVTMAIRAYILSEGRGTRGKLEGAYEIPIAMHLVETGEISVAGVNTDTLRWGNLLMNSITAVVEGA